MDSDFVCGRSAFPWCNLALDFDGRTGHYAPIAGDDVSEHVWGRCNPDSLDERPEDPFGAEVSDVVTEGGNAEGANCVFPFFYQV